MSETLFALLLVLFAPISPIIALIVIAKWKTREATEQHEMIKEVEP